MKTFIAALIIFVLLFTSVLLVSGFARGRISSLISLAQELPADGAFPSDITAQKAESLHTEWEKNMRFLSYIASYDALGEAGGAADALTAAARTESAEDFTAARLRFIEAMRRLHLLFSVSAESIL